MSEVTFSHCQFSLINCIYLLISRLNVLLNPFDCSVLSRVRLRELASFIWESVFFNRMEIGKALLSISNDGADFCTCQPCMYVGALQSLPLIQCGRDHFKGKHDLNGEDMWLCSNVQLLQYVQFLLLINLPLVSLFSASPSSFYLLSLFCVLVGIPPPPKLCQRH